MKAWQETAWRLAFPLALTVGLFAGFGVWWGLEWLGGWLGNQDILTACPYGSEFCNAQPTAGGEGIAAVLPIIAGVAVSIGSIGLYQAAYTQARQTHD